jgi:acyl-coenzyme A thioesterase PaaI-like protein
MSGPPHILNGGIIGALIDCHCICTAIMSAYRAEERAPDTEPRIWYATGTLNVTYLRPTPIDRTVLLRARVDEMTERKTVLSCSVSSGEEKTALGELVDVRVPAEWSIPV